MTRKRAKPASREWSGPRPTPEAVRTPSLAPAYPGRVLSFTPIPGHLGNVGEDVSLLGKSMYLRLNKSIRRLADRYRELGWIPQSVRGLARATTRASKRRYYSGVVERAIAGRMANLEDLEVFMRANYVGLRAPLLLISQVARSGGSLLSQLLDGHSGIAAYPQELRFGWGIKGWPPLAPALGADASFRLLFDSNFPRLVRRGLTKGHRNTVRQRFALISRLEYALFTQLWKNEPPTNSRMILDYFFTAFFNGWLDYQGDLNRKQWLTGFAPRLACDEASTESYFEAYPDGRLIQIIRDPRSWYPSAIRNKKQSAAKGAQTILAKWTASAQSMLRNKSRYGDRVIVLRFEDLIERTEETMRQLAADIGIPYQLTLVEPTVNGQPLFANSSFAVETTGIIAAPVGRGAMLSEDERQIIESQCGALYEQVVDMSASPDRRDRAWHRIRLHFRASALAGRLFRNG